MDDFSYFQINKNYAESTVLIDENSSQKKTLTQPSKVLEGLKVKKSENIFLVDGQKMSFLLYKIKNLCLKTIFKLFARVFGDFIPLELCWAV